MAEIRFVEIGEALRIHKRQVDRFGGDDGIHRTGPESLRVGAM